MERLLLRIAILLVFLLYFLVFNINKDKILKKWDIYYRPSWFPDCHFCFGHWIGFFIGLLIGLLW